MIPVILMIMDRIRGEVESGGRRDRRAEGKEALLDGYQETLQSGLEPSVASGEFIQRLGLMSRVLFGFE